MGRMDAERDGIYVVRKGRRLSYYIPCSKCGVKFESHQYTGSRKYLCPYCLRKQKKIIRKSNEWQDGKTLSDIRFDKAVSKIKQQTKNSCMYNRAINIAKSRCEKYGSIPEAMAAIELIRLKYLIIPQQKIGRYKVDFAIPKNKLIVEIDGSVYHQNKEKELQRDASIQYSLGLDWRIIHVPADIISDNILLLKTIIDNTESIR